MTKKNMNCKKEMICDYCGMCFRFKSHLIRHIITHTKTSLQKLRHNCEKCNLAFSNRGLLMCHMSKVHKSKGARPAVIRSAAMEKKLHQILCTACQINFYHQKELQYHIRQFHFNLLSHFPYEHFKKINQVWFEKVLNSKSIVEIKKVAQNILLLRKLDDNTAMKVSDQTTEVIDLRELYPIQCENKIPCPRCNKMYDKIYLSRHMTEHCAFRECKLECDAKI